MQYFRPSLSYHVSLRFVFCLFLSDCFTQILLLCNYHSLNGRNVFFLHSSLELTTVSWQQNSLTRPVFSNQPSSSSNNNSSSSKPRDPPLAHPQDHHIQHPSIPFHLVAKASPYQPCSHQLALLHRISWAFHIPIVVKELPSILNRSRQTIMLR